MTKEQKEWLAEAGKFCSDATDKKILVMFRSDTTETSPSDTPSPDHQVVITNATTPEQICWLARTINGEVNGDDGSGDDWDRGEG